MIREGPRIETERLILRAWRKDDFRPWHAIVSHPDVHKHFGSEPMSAEDCWRRMMASVGGWQLNGFGTWAVDRKPDGKLVGNVGFFTAWREMEPQFGDEPEMGWMFAAETHGQGLASEACEAAIAWARSQSAADPHLGDHRASERAVVEASGQARLRALQGETDYHGDRTLVLRRPVWS